MTRLGDIISGKVQVVLERVERLLTRIEEALLEAARR